MIDWLTLRTPINHFIESHLAEQFMSHVGEVQHFDSNGNKTHTRFVFDIDSLSSDSKGIFWQIQNSGKGLFLAIGASPASLEFNNNVFGSDDIRYCANFLISTAEKHLSMILPPPSAWQCRRIDITENYLLDNNSQVKQALRELRLGDGSRQKAVNLKQSDTVYWGHGSDYTTGKAYDKGTQVEYLEKKNQKKNKPNVFDEYTLSILKRLLRLELSLKRLWHEKHTQDYLTITPEQLRDIHTKYFSQFIGTLEVTDMTTLLDNLILISPSKGQALAAHRTWALIKSIGYEQTKFSMPESTFMRHQAILKKAGLSVSDLQSATILNFRKQSIVLSEPIRCWNDLLQAA
jgi:II/X family phage/plasmid replication protein